MFSHWCVQLNIPTVVMGNEEEEFRERRGLGLCGLTQIKKQQHIINITEQVYIQLKYKQWLFMIFYTVWITKTQFKDFFGIF